jgi:hypothetical protein
VTGYPSFWMNYFLPFKRHQETNIATALVFRGNERQQDIITRLLRQDVDANKISTVIFKTSTLMMFKVVVLGKFWMWPCATIPFIN